MIKNLIQNYEDIKQIIHFFRNNWDIRILEISSREKIELTNEEFNKIFEKEPDEVKIKDDIITEYFRYYEGYEDSGYDVFSEIYIDYYIEDGKIRVIRIKMERWLEYE